MAKILILTDGKAGHENQSKAFARALGCGFELRDIRFRSKFAKAMSYLLDHLGILTDKLLDCEVDPEERERFLGVIGTGSGTFYAAKVFAHKMGVKCGVVLYPRGYRLSTFDCILAPAFDRPARRANVIEIPANLVAADPAFYADGVKAFKTRYDGATDRAVAVIVGGPNACSTMSVEWMKKALDRVFAENKGAQFWVTTSRRTPPEIESVVDSYPWNYRLIYSRERFNPIPAFVALAKRLYVTAESTGMLSEACTSGTAEVFALDNLVQGKHKFRRFVEGLSQKGYLNGSRKVDLSEVISVAKRRMGG